MARVPVPSSRDYERWVRRIFGDQRQRVTRALVDCMERWFRERLPAFNGEVSEAAAGDLRADLDACLRRTALLEQRRRIDPDALARDLAILAALVDLRAFREQWRVLRSVGYPADALAIRLGVRPDQQGIPRYVDNRGRIDPTTPPVAPLPGAPTGRNRPPAPSAAPAGPPGPGGGGVSSPPGGGPGGGRVSFGGGERVHGIDIMPTPGARQRVTAWVQENVDLIRATESLPVQRHAAWLAENVRRGVRPDVLAKAMRERFGLSERKAILIARDQIGKLNARVAADVQQTAGVTEYTWQTSLDARVRGNPAGKWPEGNHYQLHGTTWNWGEGGAPDAGPYGERAHPGEAIQCRCWARPVLPEAVSEAAKRPASPPPRVG